VSVRLAIQRSALVAQGLLLLVFEVVLVQRAFQRQCAGISAVKGGQGGLVCESFLARGGLLFVGAAIIVATIALIDLGAARRPHSRLGSSVLVLQAPLAALEAMALVSWYEARAGVWILYGFIALTVSALIAIASPHWARLRAWSKRPTAGTLLRPDK
jgi:hypothetical protein